MCGVRLHLRVRLSVCLCLSICVFMCASLHVRVCLSACVSGCDGLSLAVPLCLDISGVSHTYLWLVARRKRLRRCYLQHMEQLHSLAVVMTAAAAAVTVGVRSEV